MTPGFNATSANAVFLFEAGFEIGEAVLCHMKLCNFVVGNIFFEERVL